MNAERIIGRIVELSAIVIICGMPSIGAYLLLRWLAGPFAVAALPLALCLALVCLATVPPAIRASQTQEQATHGNDGQDGYYWSD